MRGDYERYLKQARQLLWMLLVSLYEQQISEFL